MIERSFPADDLATSYRPLQSMATATKHLYAVECRQYEPSPRLRRYVSCYWTIRSLKPVRKSISHRIVPDGCIDIVFDQSGDSDLDSPVIVGTMTRPAFAELKGQVDYLGVRFLPGGFPYFFDCRAGELTDEIVALDHVAGEMTKGLAARLADQATVSHRLALLENQLGRIFNGDKRIDVAVLLALGSIVRTGGVVTVQELSRIANCSQRHLRREFKRWIGVGPKGLSRVIRFQSVLRAIRDGKCGSLAAAALDFGFWDQAHLVHEFNTFCGATPTAFLGTIKS